MARGADAAGRRCRQAYGAVFGMVERQAAMLSFVDTFRMMGAHLPAGDPAAVSHAAPAPALH